MSKVKELKEKTKAELEKLLKTKQEELRILRFKHAGGELKDVKSIGVGKKMIARILTLINVNDTFHDTKK